MASLPNIPGQISEEPLYNIGVVTRMTGISMATLRAWERRYNFPESRRTTGGHRLYSEKDVMQLRWVKDRIDEGMQTAQAIHALHVQEDKGLVTPAPVTPPARTLNNQDQQPALSVLRQQLFEALASRQLDRADQVLGEGLAIVSPEELILNVISPTLSEIGDAWQEKKLSVATEHLATNYLRQRLLMWMISGPPAQTRIPITLACAPGELHEGSLLILGALLRRRRYPVAYLGQSVPLPDLATFIHELMPPLVVITAMTEESAAELSNWPQWIPDAAQQGHPIIGFGGRVFSLQPEWRVRVPGIFLGTTIEQGLENIEHLLR